MYKGKYGRSPAQEVERIMRLSRLIRANISGAYLMLMAGAWAETTISNFVVTQRTGTKLADITYDLNSDAINGYVSLTVSYNDEVINAESLSGHIGCVVPGSEKTITWDMEADWNTNVAELTFTLTAQTDYMVVDLSAGPAATNYPVSYLDDIPLGGWTDGYKTTNMVLRRIPAGIFTMGSPSNELGRLTNEAQHSVMLTKYYYIGVFEVTTRQWERVMGNWPSIPSFTSAYYHTFPVNQINYMDIRGTVAGTNWPADGNVDTNSFMGRLRTKVGLSTFDLPTEAQWEYACRAGTTNALNSGKDLTTISNCPNMSAVGRYWYNGGSSYRPTKVGLYEPNMWGLYDMHGNVLEWCLDWYADANTGTIDPPGPSTGSHRVSRGGYWDMGAAGCRSARRYQNSPQLIYHGNGFRVLLSSWGP